MNLEVFKNNEFGRVRVINYLGEPYAVGVDVARALEYSNPSKAVIDHCKGITKLGIPSKGGVQETNLIAEGDIYRLIIKAADQTRNPEIKEKAERFERWVFDEVLPSIRKHGVYASANSMSVAQMLNKQVAIVINEVDNLSGRVEYLEGSMTVDYGQQNRLQTKGRETALKALGGSDSPAYANKSLTHKVFSALWRDYKDYFAVASYRDTSRVDFDKAMAYLANWRAQGALLREIELVNASREAS